MIARTARQLPLIVVLVLVLALAPIAFAGKGGGKPSGTSGTALSLVMVSDASTPGVSYGDTVTFSVSTSVSYPSVELDCSQGGTLVYSHIAGFYASFGWTKNYTLGSSNWTGGGASCTATLYYTTRNGTNSTLATLNFAVGA